MKAVIPLFFCLTLPLFAYAVMGGVFFVVYSIVFRPVKRPNYSATAGEYCLKKLKSPLFRKEFYYKAGSSRLKGYFYPSKNSKKLIVLCHGFRSGADDFLPLIKELVWRGFNLFTYDVTATYDSKGRSLGGACRWLVDLDNTLSYLKSNDEYRHFKVYLIGHSLGGYAVLSALSMHKQIRGCVALAPVNDACSLTIETAKARLGGWVKITKPFFDALQGARFKKYTKHTAVKGINSVTTPVLVVQGDCDKVLSFGGVSVFAHRDEITNPNARFLQTKGLIGGHSSVWHSKRAVVYKAVIDGRYKLIQRGKRWAKRGKKSGYFSDVNDYLYSQPNSAIIRQINKIFY